MSVNCTNDTKVTQEKVQEEVGEVNSDKDTAAMPPPPQKVIDIEKTEEQKLKSKFPALGGRHGGGGQSAFLQKRLGKGQKYFDSGDYQMAKQGGRQGRGPLAVLAPPTGEEHPTPATVPARKSSILPAGHALPVAQPSSPSLVQ